MASTVKLIAGGRTINKGICFAHEFWDLQLIFIPLGSSYFFFSKCLLFGRLLRDVFDPTLQQFFDLDLALDIFELEHPQRLLFEH